MVYKIPVELIKDKAPKTKKPKKPLTVAQKEARIKDIILGHARSNAYNYYETRKPLERTTMKRKRKGTGFWIDPEETTFWDGIEKLRKKQPEKTTTKPVKKPKVVKKEIEVVIDPKTGIIREKPRKKAIPRNLEDLKKIKVLKDEIEALKTRMVRKDATIKNLKRKIEKLKEEIERPEKEKREEREFYIDNPDFLEIN